ncbi:hypothetical protein [Halobacterium wangiae]|uniref:hypothetical protein n=1 Tax=Halobacterium wangiae TaxID=2902623 RepID=UPI001E33F9CF|nr:hypothetical protein [Halobacterium wangiae]
MNHTRRHVLRGFAAGGAAVLAGCLGGGGAGRPVPSTPGTTASASTDSEPVPPPTASEARHVPYDPETLRDNVVTGGVVKDGIPAIDDPQFSPADDGMHAFENPGYEFAATADGIEADGVKWDGATGENADGRTLERIPSRRRVLLV